MVRLEIRREKKINRMCVAWQTNQADKAERIEISKINVGDIKTLLTEETLDLLNDTNTISFMRFPLLRRWEFISGNTKNKLIFKAGTHTHSNRVKTFEKLHQIYYRKALAIFLIPNAYTHTSHGIAKRNLCQATG